MISRLASSGSLVMGVLLVNAGCSGGSGGGGSETKGQPVSLAPSTESSAEQAALRSMLATETSADADALADRYAPAVAPEPAYDRDALQGLDRLQGSSIALSDADVDVLARRGFLITDANRYPTFTYAYGVAYMEHLPVYISADSILFAVHRSYDTILKTIEQDRLIGDLTTLLTGMRARLASGALADASFGAGVTYDVDLYLAVALSLLTGKAADPVLGGDITTVDDLVKKAQAASGARQVLLFGSQRTIDFSEFEPRGHYTDSTELSQYFRAMIWLGRTDLRLIETQSDGSQVFVRRQFEDVVALRTLIDTELEASYRHIDDAVSAFVGDQDNMVIDDVPRLLAALGAASPAALASVSDQTIAQAVIDGGYGTQQIASQIMVNGLGAGTLPLARSFALLGQRFAIDSQVFSNVVYDRVQGGSVRRMMPNPLDVAFSVFANGSAVPLLASELERYSYAPDLSAMRLLVDAHVDDFWSKNLYNGWLASLRAVSPPAASAMQDTALAPTFRTEAWQHRLLNTQLASWAELRHDTILYVKQSYTGGATCDFPDAYVDPYPEFFARIVEYANHGKELVSKLADDVATDEVFRGISEHFDQLASAATALGDMAEYELSGEPFTDEMLAFVNQAVVIQRLCGAAFGTGWYPNLFYGDSVEFDPTIADVHTQPTDEAGNPVGRVLHVGTGYARMMIVAVENCTGPRVYAGPVSSYFERTTEQYQRLNDQDWADQVNQGPADVPWMADLITR